MAKNKGKKIIKLNTSPESYIKTRARNLPLSKCYINKTWKTKGFATILTSRTHTNGNFTFALFLVDLYCLGVKETFYVFNKYSEFHELLERMEEEEEMVEVKYALAHNIIYGGIEYDASFCFSPPKDFEVSKYLLE